MKVRVPQAVRILVPLVLLGSAVSGAPQQGVAATRAASGLVRYTSTAYGYTLLVPSSWARLYHLPWASAGPPADLTVMTPDHQAALGIIVAPTGSRHYSDVELQGVALRLLYQENGIIPTIPIAQKRVVVNGVTFQTALVPSFSGATYTYSSQTVISVWVTQRFNRLYAIAGLVYNRQAAPPPPTQNGPEPTPTPEGGDSVVPASGRDQPVTSQESAGPLLGPAARMAALARQPMQSPADAPGPLPTDHLRGNPCPDATDGALIIRDKNCAAPAETQALGAMAHSFAFTSRVSTDPRPAAPVGVDAFAVASSSALGVQLEYPAQWKALSMPNTNLAVRSADQNTLVTLTVQRTDAASLASSDLQSIAASQIAQVASGPPPSYRTMRVDGVLYLRAFLALAIIVPPGGGSVQAQVSVTLASYHHRVYSLRAVAATYLGSLAENSAPPAVYPYFTPFTTLARLTQSTVDLLVQQSNLAAQTTGSLFVDPHVPDA